MNGLVEGTSGHHEHCFCRLGTGGQPICCKCGARCEAKIIDVDAFILWEQLEHEKQLIIHGETEEQRKLL